MHTLRTDPRRGFIFISPYDLRNGEINLTNVSHLLDALHPDGNKNVNRKLMAIRVRHQTAFIKQHRAQSPTPPNLRPHQIAIRTILIVLLRLTIPLSPPTAQLPQISRPLILTRIIRFRYQRKLKRNRPRSYIEIIIVSRYWHGVK